MDTTLRSSAYRNYRLALQMKEDDQEPIFYIGCLNAIRNVEFVESCLLIVIAHNIDVTVDL